MLSNSEFGEGTVKDPFAKMRQESRERMAAHSTNPFSLAPHAEGYSSSSDFMLSQPQSGHRQVQVAPIGKGALKGSFAFKQTAFD